MFSFAWACFVIPLEEENVKVTLLLGGKEEGLARGYIIGYPISINAS